MNYKLITVLLHIVPLFALSQETNIVKVSNSCGKVALHEDITIAEARNKAIFQAKLVSMNQAGVPNRISSTSLLISTQLSQLNYNQSYFELASDEMDGVVVGFDVISEKRETVNDVIGVEVCINADVLLFKEKPDPSFTIEVAGIRELYYDKEKLSFSVKPNSEGYLRIFILEDESAQILYPNEKEFREPTAFRFYPGVNYNFPTKAAFEYTLVAEVPEVFHQLIFVYSKVDFQIITDLTPAKIRKQIYSLPRDMIHIQSFVYKLKAKR